MARFDLSARRMNAIYRLNAMAVDRQQEEDQAVWIPAKVVQFKGYYYRYRVASKSLSLIIIARQPSSGCNDVQKRPCRR